MDDALPADLSGALQAAREIYDPLVAVMQIAEAGQTRAILNVLLTEEWREAALRLPGAPTANRATLAAFVPKLKRVSLGRVECGGLTSSSNTACGLLLLLAERLCEPAATFTANDWRTKRDSGRGKSDQKAADELAVVFLEHMKALADGYQPFASSEWVGLWASIESEFGRLADRRLLFGSRNGTPSDMAASGTRKTRNTYGRFICERWLAWSSKHGDDRPAFITWFNRKHAGRGKWKGERRIDPKRLSGALKLLKQNQQPNAAGDSQ